MLAVSDCLKYATALRETDRCPRTLKLAFNELKDEGAIIISKFLSEFPLLTCLDLGFNDIGDAGVEALARSLEDNSTLQILHLSGNAVTANGLLFLSKALEVNTTLVSLYLSGNSGSTAGACALAQSLHTNVSLQVLCLNGNNVQEQGALCIGEMLKINRALTHLNLSHNEIGDAGIASVADALNVNSNMKNLEFSFNGITSIGVQSLCASVSGYTRLDRLLLDNNAMGAEGAKMLAEILPSMNLSELNIGFNDIDAAGLTSVLSSLVSNKYLKSLTLSGNTIDVSVSRLMAFFLVHNTVLQKLYLDRTKMDLRSEKNIAAGLASSKLSTLRTLTGFSLGPVLAALGSPSLLENYSNERVLSYLSQLWESHRGAEKPQQTDTDTSSDPYSPSTFHGYNAYSDGSATSSGANPSSTSYSEKSLDDSTSCGSKSTSLSGSQHSDLQNTATKKENRISSHGSIANSNDVSGDGLRGNNSSKKLDIVEHTSDHFDGFCGVDMKKRFSHAGVCAVTCDVGNKVSEDASVGHFNPYNLFEKTREDTENEEPEDEDDDRSAEDLLSIVDTALCDPAVVQALNQDLKKFYGRSVSCTNIVSYNPDNSFLTRRTGKQKRKLSKVGGVQTCMLDFPEPFYGSKVSGVASAGSQHHSNPEMRKSSAMDPEPKLESRGMWKTNTVSSDIGSSDSTNSSCSFLEPSVFTPSHASTNSLDIIKKRRVSFPLSFRNR